MKWLALMVLMFSTSVVLAQGWIDQLDLPLMQGMVLEPEQQTVFETATGRVILSEISGEVAPDAVRRYYADALPGLGWLAEGQGSYSREDERLVIEIEQRGGRTFAGFRLAPR